MITESNEPNHGAVTGPVEEARPENDAKKSETQRLKEIFAPGHYLIRLRRGEEVKLSLKNPYLFEALRMPGMLFTKPEIKDRFPGMFPEPSRKTVMEIGCYMGHTLEELGKNNPDLNFLGVDIKYKRVVKTCRRVKRAGLTNTKVAVADGREVIASVPDHSLYGLIAFFPDPWRRKKHEKHRFLNADFFRAASRKLSPRGFVWIKTDSKEYLDEAWERARPFGFQRVESLPRPLIGPDHLTLFERMFAGMNRPIHQMVLELEPGVSE